MTPQNSNAKQLKKANTRLIGCPSGWDGCGYLRVWACLLMYIIGQCFIPTTKSKLNSTSLAATHSHRVILIDSNTQMYCVYSNKAIRLLRFRHNAWKFVTALAAQ